MFAASAGPKRVAVMSSTPNAISSNAEHAVMPAGVQMAKMTPFRSYVITTASTLTSAICFGLRLGGGMTSHINVRLACVLTQQHHW